MALVGMALVGSCTYYVMKHSIMAGNNLEAHKVR